MTHKCIVVDLDRCIGCFSCEISCKNENAIPLGEQWNKVIIEGPTGTFPDIEEYWLPTMCQQCQNAPCVNVCPTGASYRNDENIVLINKEKCIGCKYCMMACPYGVRSWNSTEKCVEKCTLCPQLTEAGYQPACVANCPGECRFYGDLDDPESAPSQALAAADADAIHHLTDVGNTPSTAYILHKKIATWRSSEE
jgi:Fe-S-cluster-containing dehydrogenase component